MANLTKDQKRDHRKFFKEKGDIGFSPKRNKTVVDGTIKKYEAMRKQRSKQYGEQVRDRADAVATYLKHLAYGKSTTVEKYFGRKELARLQGKKILATIKNQHTRLREIQ